MLHIFYNAPSDLSIKVFGSSILLFALFIPFELMFLNELGKAFYTTFMENDFNLYNIEGGN